MMKRKTWALLTCAMLILAIVGASLLVIFVDPFQVYRLATLYMPPIDNTTQVYANAGIARKCHRRHIRDGELSPVADGRAARRTLHQALHPVRNGI